LILQLADEQQYNGLNNFFKNFQKNVKISGIELENLKNVFGEIKKDGVMDAVIFAPEDLEINRLKEYNQYIDQGKDATEAYVLSMDGANETTIAYADNLNGAKANLKQYTLGAKAATVGTKLLSAAIQAVGTAILIGLVTEGIRLLIEFVDNTIHAAENAKEKISDLTSEYENGVSELESLNSELETTKKRIAEIQSQGKISFTDQEELDNLKEQNLELERQIDLQNKINQQKANEVVAEIRDNYDSGVLPDDFEKSLNNYIRTLETLEEYKKDGLEGISLGVVTQENYETTIGHYSDSLNDYYSTLLDNIQTFEEHRQSIIDKYNGNIEDVVGDDLTLLNDITKQLNEAYKAIYSNAEYNKFVIEPIFDEAGLENLQTELTTYFINGGELDIEALEEKFGVSIILALRNACKNAGLELEELLAELFDQAQNTSYGFVNNINTPNGAYEARLKAEDDKKLDYFNSLDEETQQLVINAEIPEHVKKGTLEDFIYFIQDLQEEAGITIEPIEFSPTDFSAQMETLSSLSSLYENYKTSLEETGEFTPLDITEVEALREKFGQYVSDFDELERVLTSSETKAKDAQKAFDTLASEYIVGSGALEGLTTATRDQIVSQLELNGIVNASEIITEELAELYETMYKKGYNLVDMTEEEIVKFFEEAEAGDEARMSLARLEIAKELLNAGTIDTSDEVESLLNIARAAGVAEEKLSGVIAANAWITGANGMPSYIADMKKAQTTIDDFHLDDFGLDYDGKSGGSGSGSSGDPWKEKFEQELSDLKYLRDMGKLMPITIVM